MLRTLTDSRHGLPEAAGSGVRNVALVYHESATLLAAAVQDQIARRGARHSGHKRQNIGDRGGVRGKDFHLGRMQFVAFGGRLIDRRSFFRHIERGVADLRVQDHGRLSGRLSVDLNGDGSLVKALLGRMNGPSSAREVLEIRHAHGLGRARAAV